MGPPSSNERYHANIRIKKDIYKKDIITICNDLGMIFGSGNSFSPLKRGGGGIAWDTWSNGEDKTGMVHAGHSSKSIRFYSKGSWPLVPEDSMVSWKDSNEIVFKCDGQDET